MKYKTNKPDEIGKGGSKRARLPVEDEYQCPCVLYNNRYPELLIPCDYMGKKLSLSRLKEHLKGHLKLEICCKCRHRARSLADIEKHINTTACKTRAMSLQNNAEAWRKMSTKRNQCLELYYNKILPREMSYEDIRKVIFSKAELFLDNDNKRLSSVSEAQLSEPSHTATPELGIYQRAENRVPTIDGGPPFQVYGDNQTASQSQGPTYTKVGPSAGNYFGQQENIFTRPGSSNVGDDVRIAELQKLRELAEWIKKNRPEVFTFWEDTVDKQPGVQSQYLSNNINAAPINTPSNFQDEPLQLTSQGHGLSTTHFAPPLFVNTNNFGYTNAYQ